MHTIGGGTSFTLREQKFIIPPANPAAKGHNALEVGHVGFGTKGLLMSRAPSTHRPNCSGHLGGIFSPSIKRLSRTKNIGDNVTTVTIASPRGRQDRIETQKRLRNEM
jgi:hypothetical protein